MAAMAGAILIPATIWLALRQESGDETMDPEKLKMIKNRIESGYYNRPDVASDIADKLLGGEKSKRNSLG